MTPIAAPKIDEDKVIPLFADGRREDINDAYRLERAIKRVRKLLDDPVALRLRARALLDGTAKPLLTLAFVVLTVVRMVGGPSAPGYFTTVPSHRKGAAVVTQPAIQLEQASLDRVAGADRSVCR